MATPSDQLDQLIATTFESVRPALADNITVDLPLLAFLDSKAKVTVDGGRSIVRPLMYALNDTVKSYDGYDLFDTTAQGGIGEAIYPWKNMVGTVTISGDEIRKNSGKPAFISLMASKAEQLRLSIDDVFNSMLHGDGTGNSGKDFLGLKAVVRATGTLGGIDPTTETFWKAKEVAGPVDLTTAAGIASLNNVFNSLAVQKSRPDIELTTQLNFEAYEALATEKVRYTSVRMADLGFEALAHKTAEVVFDADTPNDLGTANDGGYWYFLNSRFLEFVRHADSWLTPTDFVRPYNQDAKVMSVISTGNLITSNRRANGVILETTT